MQSIPSRRRSLQLSCLAAITAFAAVPAMAQFTWDGGGADQNFSTDDNWVGNVAPANNDSADFTFAGGTGLAPVNDRTSLTIRALTFDSGSSPFVISGSGIDKRTGPADGITNNSSSLQTINLAMDLKQHAGNADLNVNAASGNIALGGQITGTNFQITKSGPFTLQLNNGNSTLSNTFGPTMLANGGTIQFGASTSVDGGGVVLSGPIGVGELRTGTTMTFQTDGVDRTVANSVQIQGNVVMGNSGGSTLTLGNSANGISLAGGLRIFTVSNAADELVLAGNVSVGSIVKAGPGTMTLTGANTYNGTTQVSGGTLVLGASNVLPNTTNVTLSGGTLLQNGNSDTAGTLNVTAASIIDMAATGTLTFAGNAGVWTGALQVWNWNNTEWQSGTSEYLLFNNLSGYVAGTTYSSIQFYSDSGTTPIGSGGTFAYAGFDSSFYLIAVPEPGAVAGVLALLLPIAWRDRRGWMRCRSAVEATRAA